MRQPSLRRVTFSLFLLAAGVGCSESGDPPPTTMTVRPAVDRVEVDPTSAMVVIGEPLQLTATLRDAAGNKLSGRGVSWSTSQQSVANVTSSGMVTGVAPSNQQVIITATSEGKSASSSIIVVSVAKFTQISVGGGHTCGIAITKAAYCWGSNSYGQLGTNGSTTIVRDTPQAVVGGLSFAFLAAGRFHACGITTQGATYCWGWYDVSLGAKSIPTQIPTSVQFVELAATYGSTCGRTPANSIYCWGINSFGELGDNSVVSRSTPAPIAGGQSFLQLVAGDGHYCALTQAGAAYCWGDNRYGAIGTGNTVNRLTPSAVVGGLQFSSIVAGALHTCGLTPNGAAYCWGSNFGMQIGDNASTDRASPTLVNGSLQFASLAAGAFHTCGRTSANVTYCWGNNGTGALGDNSTNSHGTPGPIFGELRFVDLDAGWQTCGRTATNATYCWGGTTYTGPLKPTGVSDPL